MMSKGLPRCDGGGEMDLPPSQPVPADCNATPELGFTECGNRAVFHFRITPDRFMKGVFRCC